MAGKGYIISEHLDGGVRILPPSGWGAVYGGMATFAVNLIEKPGPRATSKGI